MKFSFKAILKASNSDIVQNIYLTNNDVQKLEKEIINTAFDFANKHDFNMALNYFDDSISPSFDDENCQEVYIEYIESNIFSEDEFDIMWDNYMKMLGRGK